jgi:hypothetical protein
MPRFRRPHRQLRRPAGRTVRLGVFELDSACDDAFIVLRAAQRGLLTRGPRAAAQTAAFYGQGCPALPDFCARRFDPPLGRVVTCSWHLGCVCTGRGRVRCPDELAGRSLRWSPSYRNAVVPESRCRSRLRHGRWTGAWRRVIYMERRLPGYAGMGAAQRTA